MARFLYSLLISLLSPLFVLRLLVKSVNEPGYRRQWWRRFALGMPSRVRSGDGLIWVHAVSVGELLAVAPLVERMLQEWPDKAVLITNTTPTGSEQTQKLFGGRVEHTWFPFDTPLVTGAFLRHWSPQLVVMVETEIWPNIMASAREQGIPVALVNARLSARSARGYARLGEFTRQTLKGFSLIAAQSKSDDRRFRRIGADPDAMQVVGSIKFDIDLAARRGQLEVIKSELGSDIKSRPLWAAASTHPGEEQLVIDAYQALRQRGIATRLLLAPRHPNRTGDIIKLLEKAGLSYQRRSERVAINVDTDVLIIDTLGELSAFLGLADAAFIGGSLVPRGGHNPIEAAAWGCAVITGPHVINFATIVRDMERGGAIRVVVDQEELADRLASVWEGDKQDSDAKRAQTFIETRRGATRRQLDLLKALL
ncbi:MAG: 3-deoxy-D-manno-octulosonic acid transferase [Proteobacteria bacterium]|nr:MAG: 3-deoxy-D-manno-octulosonic acid transferase [Pseudomonadota bacterium]